MTPTLGDILLVFLDDQPGTPYELRQRLTGTFASQFPADVTRVMSALVRLERYGYTEARRTPTDLRRRTWQLTGTGHRRQHTWLLELPEESESQDILIRVLLAVEATARPMFEAVVDSYLAVIAKRRIQPAIRLESFTSVDVRAEFERAESTAMAEWLRELRRRPRKRDHQAGGG